MMCTSIAKVDLFLSHNTFFIICVNHKHQLYCNLFQLTFFLLLFLRQGIPYQVDPYLHSCFNEMLTNGVKMLPHIFNLVISGSIISFAKLSPQLQVKLGLKAELALFLLNPAPPAPPPAALCIFFLEI